MVVVVVEWVIEGRRWRHVAWCITADPAAHDAHLHVVVVMTCMVVVERVCCRCCCDRRCSRTRLVQQVSVVEVLRWRLT